MNRTVGVDIGGTKIAAAAVDGSGMVTHRARRDTPAHDAQSIASAAAQAVGEVRAQVEADGDTVVAVGLACAGFVDAAGGRVLFAPNLAWRDEPIQRRVEMLVDLPVILDNDANAAAWGEFRFGAGKGVEEMILVTLGTGVGGGIITRGRLNRGASGIAAEVGHLRVVPGGRLCGCGNRGCWEQYASGNALVREARALIRDGAPAAAGLAQRCGGDPGRLTGADITAAAKEGEPVAVELFNGLGRWVGEGIASLVAVLDPAIVVVGGGVSEAGDLLLDPARAAFAEQLTGRGHRPEAPIVPAALGNDAGVIGAADLAH